MTGKINASPVAASDLHRTVRRDVNRLLSAFCTDRTAQAASMSPQFERLWHELARLSQAGGKRLRPYIVMLAYRCFGGSDQKDILPVAVSWELLHLSMLIHDDIIDHDLVRYGVLNIAGSYREIYRETEGDVHRRDHLADAAALLAGDLALSAAYEIVLESNLSMVDKMESQRFLSRAMFTVAGGELLDTEATLYPMAEADPLLIARLKTASYSFIGPLTSGAYLAGASKVACQTMEELGRLLGCAYQLADDVIGVFGNPALTGKSITGDLSEGKRTYLMQQTFLSASAADRKILDEFVGKPDLGDDEAQAIREIITRGGARRLTEAAADAYAEQAHQLVERIEGLQSPAKLHELIAVITGRDR
jgi:geranylgeranyl pyrophosphate synthase